MNRILVIEDDDGIRDNLRELLEMENYTVQEAADGEEGVRLALTTPPDLVICDIMMPELDGYGVLGALKKNHRTSQIPFIFLTARAGRADVRRGMNSGASDYIPKPFSRVEILESIEARLKLQEFRSESPSIPGASARPGKMVLADPNMLALMDQLDRVAKGMISVMVLGETGVGKEVIAQEVHRRSGRSGSFVALNCAALSESLLESELFGHEKGAFTGAVAAKKGLFEAADRGTLFLDELGEMPLGTQVKLLRVLEERQVVRVGGRTPRSVDVRFLSATNQDVAKQSENGNFRQDLLYRLNGATLRVPALRNRIKDIAPLAAQFVKNCCELSGRADVPVISAAAQQQLEHHDWPGNIRELRNVVERAVLLCEGSEIEERHLFEEPQSSEGTTQERSSSGPPSRERLARQLDDLERQRVVDALANCGGNQTQAAAILGISRRTLVTRLDQYGLPRPRKRSR
jgi:DNA-binding NtrC family response regulator